MQSLNSSNQNNYIYLYNGKGTGQVSSAQAEKSFKKYLGYRSANLITINDPSYFQNPRRMTSAACVVFPGGNAYQIADALDNAGINGVKTLVEDQKASYIGLCAGGYLAAITEYDFYSNKRILDRKTLNYQLHISSYRHYGPTYPMDDTASLKTATSVPVQHINREAPYYSSPFHVYWNGGGYLNFVNPWQDVSIASYATADLSEGEKIAVVNERHKGTQVVISYVHPEIRLTAEEIEKYCPQLEHKEQYLASAPEQEALFAEICQSADIPASPI